MALFVSNTAIAGANEEDTPKGCIVSLQTGAEYCLPVGQRSGYSLPSWIYAHEVRVQTEQGAAVMLSDWDNLSYNRLAVFSGTVTNHELTNVKAYNGQHLDFSSPRSMRVVASNDKLGCIISLQTGDKYCLPVGKRSGYSLPSWIYAHEVYVQANEGAAVMLSDWDNLSYNRLAVFSGTTENRKMTNVKAYNGQYLDFSAPRSMRVVADSKPLGCIVSLETGARYCLPVGQRSGYSLPSWIRAHEVYVEPSEGTAVMLSDWDNLSYNRLAVFNCVTPNKQLENVRAYNGQNLDFSSPRSMRVVQGTAVGDQTINGTAGDDVLHGCSGNDVITGFNGNDVIYGGGGNDTINGSNGDDELHGGSGDDKLFGAGGNDSLYGDEGNDILQAGYEDDIVMDGGTGKDIYIGSEGNDTMHFDQEDFSDESFLTSKGNIYTGDRGFDKVVASGDANIDFSGKSYFASGVVPGAKPMSQIEAVVAGEGNQSVTVNANAIYAQSDNFQTTTNVDPGDWDGFVAHLGDGADTLNVDAGIWSYDANASASVAISTAMINFMGLSFDQVTELKAYVFTFADKKITVWTDAETIKVNGNDI
ncbi:calcium-binding protein [Enterovibrio coralii]|uniref:Hemolysin n=1 Tax=Enterovibrio coralii TaxID=294935 RepID=A0A135I8A1_9GAMM|nr:calcium-binding protein [Enterovibrio coralii]KXF81679.1 hemolysin [Enterovibrio coralii]